ncbi:MAG TPA: glycosyltransferase family 87 protein [Candidatus Binatia bacterium]
MEAARWGGRGTVVAGAAFAVAVALTVARHLVAPLFLDFGAALFYPARAFLDGGNPYDAAWYLAHYPADSPFAYPPGVLVLALPFAALSLRAATALYLALSLTLVPVLAWLALRLAGIAPSPARVLGLAAVLLVSRPGHMVVVQGQPSLVFIVAACGALLLARRADVSAGAVALLALAMGKPTIGVPLALLCLARGWARLALGAAVVAFLVSMLAFPQVAARAGGIGALVHQVTTGSTRFGADHDNDPSRSMYRLDAIALAGRLAGRIPPAPVTAALAFGILGLAAWSARRFDRAGDAASADAMTCLAVTMCVYHQTYDALLLCGALAAAAFAVLRNARAPGSGVLLVALAIPFANHLATHAFVEHLALTGPAWLLVTCANGAAIAVAVALYSARAARLR